MYTTIKVLIVDDEERFRQTTAAILKRNGFEVTAVESGLQAIEEVKKDDFHVVILDVKMPHMDGNVALREILKIKPDLKVIMLTGHGTPESALEGLRDGVFDYLTKPCAIDLLSRKIREAVEKKEGLPSKEHSVKEIMVPLSSFSTINENMTVFDALEKILESFTRTMGTGTVQETVHRSILVLDDRKKVIGIITFTDLLKGLQPPYMRLMTERPQMADSIYLESPNYSGMFTIMARDLANTTVRKIMSEAPPLIDYRANIMEAASKLLNLGLRRLLVVENGEIVGVIREQDLFFEMFNVMKQYRSNNS